MQISSQTQVNNAITTLSQPSKDAAVEVGKVNVVDNSLKRIMETEQKVHSQEEISKEKVQKAVDSLNEFMTLQNRHSKFVMHDGLDRYYVEVVDAETDEVIREVPPRKLLDAFYSMQKFIGMIVDEKI